MRIGNCDCCCFFCQREHFHVLWLGALAWQRSRSILVSDSRVATHDKPAQRCVLLGKAGAQCHVLSTVGIIHDWSSLIHLQIQLLTLWCSKPTLIITCDAFPLQLLSRREIPISSTLSLCVVQQFCNETVPSWHEVLFVPWQGSDDNDVSLPQLPVISSLTAGSMT